MATETSPLPAPSGGRWLDLRGRDGTALAAWAIPNPRAAARVIVSHGNGLAAHGYRVFWEALCSSYEVVVHDMRGHGMSDAGPQQHHDWPQFIDDFDAVLAGIERQLGPRRTIGALHSLAAVAGLLHMYSHPGRWDALALFDLSAAPPAGHPLAALHRAEMLDRADKTQQRRARFADPAELAAQFARADRVGAWQSTAPMDMAHAVLRPAQQGWVLSCAPEREAHVYRSNVDLGAWQALARASCPVLLIGGDPNAAGALAPSLCCQAAHDALGVPHVYVPGTGHFLQLEAPQRCRQIFDEFAHAQRSPRVGTISPIAGAHPEPQGDPVNKSLHAPSRPAQRAWQGNIVDYLFEHSLDPAMIDRPYLRSGDGEHSFRDLYRRVCQAGSLLRSLGVQPGDRVMFSLRDGIDFPALFLGAIKIGAVASPINTFLQPADYAYYIEDSGARVLVVDHTLIDTIEQALQQAPRPERMFVVGADAAGFQRWESALEAMPDTLDSHPRGPDDVGFWLYSSGSTGKPKGVVHTHAHIFWATELFALGALGLTSQDVLLCPPKMFFAFGLGFQVYFPIRVAASIVVDEAPIKPAALLQKLMQYRPTVFVGVPTLYASVLEQMRALPPASRTAACERLRLCISGGEVLPTALQRDWQAATGTEILDGVGTTEMTHMFMINRPGKVVPGSCGTLVEGFSARLLDDERREVAEGEIGNLYVCGPTAAQQYWNKAEQTKRVMFDGGVLTGDKCYRDADGNYFYVGRADDMLRVGGIWVSPAEVESCLAEHSAVLECAVIGTPDEHGMIKPKAFVVLRAGHAASDALIESMRDHLRSRLAHMKCPRWIDVVSELPKTATGKIQRFRLRAAESQLQASA